jgi:hydrogenase nickel incorporation protein HypA/HybF
MHELSLAGSVLDTALRHAGDRRVVAVTLRVGHLRQVVPTTLARAFELVACGTAAEGARLDQVPVPARLLCERCEHAWELDGAPVFRCVRCGDGRGTVVGGDDLMVEPIEVEDETGEARPCTASA